MGLFVDGTDTRTPAHYHGVIGGINIGFIGVFFFFVLPLLRRPRIESRTLYLIVCCYGLGQIFHSLGLFFAGGYGAPRKTPGNISALDSFGAEFSLYAMGIGAVIAVIGGILFILTAAKLLLKDKT